MEVELEGKRRREKAVGEVKITLWNMAGLLSKVEKF